MRYNILIILATFILVSCTSFDVQAQNFEWISIYSPSAKDKSMPDIDKACDIDNDWELWGHNLHKNLGDIKDAHALVDGKLTDEQLCFTSEALYKATVEYIIDNFGEGTDTQHARITIMPDDNNMVCMCEKCKKKGNSPDNATPAVTAFLEKIAKRFPKHLFFTSAYATTKLAPNHRLPENIGVFLSAIDIPMRQKFRETRGFKDFDNSIEAWKKATHRIYVWEYARNFDDYLTPYPCLSLLKERLDYYREQSVKGVFINGSGDCYSSFDDIYTYVILHMLLDSNASVEALLSQYTHKLYPETADMILPYLKAIENEAVKRNRTLSFYGGITDSEQAFLDVNAFEKFWVTLDKKSKSVKGAERKRLNVLLTALNFTRLEILRSRAKLDKAAVADALDVMRGYAEAPSMQNYREANGSLEEYIRIWEKQPMKVENEDFIIHTKVRCSDLGEDAASPTILTDSRYGMPTDYHTNWVVSGSDTWDITVTMPSMLSLESNKTLYLGFLLAPRWRMYIPSSIVVYSDSGKEIGTYTIADADQVIDNTVFKRETISIPLKGSGNTASIRITLKRPTLNKRATIACDEIEMR